MIEHEEECVGWSDKVKCVGHYQGRPACVGCEPYCCSCHKDRKQDGKFEITNDSIIASSGSLHRLISAINNALTFNTSEFHWKDSNGVEKVLKITKDDGVA